MVGRIRNNPEYNERPDFTSDVYAVTRNALIGDATLPATDQEEAVRYLQEQWEEVNNALKVRYQAQVTEEQELMEARRQEEANAELLKEQEMRHKELELAKEAEKKRTPLYSFQKGQGISSIPLQLHPYAKKMIAARKFIPLWYFLPEAAAEAKKKGREALDTNRFQIANDEDNLSPNSGQHPNCTRFPQCHPRLSFDMGPSYAGKEHLSLLSPNWFVPKRVHRNVRRILYQHGHAPRVARDQWGGCHGALPCRNAHGLVRR